MSEHTPGDPPPDPRRVAWGDRIGEVGVLARSVVKWIVLGSCIGALAGVAIAAFLATLRWATETRLEHPWLLYLLPIAGFAVGFVYHRWSGDAAAGNNLILDEIHEPRAWIPRRMAPLIYVSSIVTQVFGGSAGREGTAIQMAGSIGDLFSRVIRLGPRDRRILLIAAIAGGFGAAFGVPFAGCVFALEVQSVGELRHEAIVPALAASVVGDAVVRGLGIEHAHLVQIDHVDLTAPLLLKVVVFGVACGLAAAAFVEITHFFKHAAERFISYPPLRPFVGGLLIIGLTGIVGTRAYLGLSEDLIVGSLAGGVGIATFAFAWKLLFTSVTLGSGFQGGEVTPLLVVGATLGATLGPVLDAPVPLLAAVGFAAVFAGASNTPIACTIMGAELFGSGALVAIAIGCVVSYAVSADRSIFSSQRRAVASSNGVGLDRTRHPEPPDEESP